MNYSEAIAYLTKCADENGVHWYQGRPWDDIESCPTCHGSNDAGWLHTPGSRYGYTSAHCAPVAWRYARISGQSLDSAMSAVVNDSDEPERALQDHAIALSGADIDGMVDGYLDAQLWAQRDNDREDDSMLDANYSRDDIAPAYVESVAAEFRELATEHPLAVRMYVNHPNVTVRYRDPHGASGNFGHDYYLTREHHGAGFWDRGLGELGRYLTDIAHYAGAAEDLWDNGSGILAA